MTPERDFQRFRDTKAPAALAAVFDATAPELARVARYLAGTGGAEDLLQTTYLAAIETAEQWDPRMPLLPWLLGILVHRARDEGRRRRRRVDPRRWTDALRPWQGREPASDAAHRERAAVCREAVAALPVHYRQVIVLHFEHGLSCREIADTLDRPAGTVRTQLVRGLDQLRARLPTGLAGIAVVDTGPPPVALDAVRTRLLTRVSGRGTPLATTPTEVARGSRVAAHRWATSTTLWAGSAGLGLVALALLLVTRADPPGPASAQPPTSVATRALRAAPLGRGGTADETLASRATASPPAAAPISVGALRVTVRGATPTESALRVFAVRTEGDNSAPSRSAVFDPTVGPAVFEDLAAGAYRVGLDRQPETVDAHVRGGATTEVSLTLRGAPTAHGTIRTPNGLPVPGASVWASHATSPPGGLLVATSAADGRYEVAAIAQGARLRARAAGRAPSAAAMVFGAAGDRVAIDLELGAVGVEIAGRVTHDGAPVPGALVALARVVDGTTRGTLLLCDAAGGFRTDEVTTGDYIAIARAPDGGEFTAAARRVRLTPDAPRWLELAIGDGAAVAGTVRSADGAPLQGVAVRLSVSGLDLAALASDLGVAETRTDAAGGFALAGLPPGRARLTARRARDTTHTALDLECGATARWDARLGTGDELSVRIVDRGGAPLSRVWLRATHRGEPPRVETAATDASGVVSFSDIPTGEYLITVHGRGAEADVFPGQRFGPLRSGNRRHELVARRVSEPRGAIRGRAIDDHGQALGGARLTLMQTAWPVARGAHASVEDGAFELGGLPLGEYHLRIEPRGRAPRVLELQLDSGRPTVDLGALVFAAPAAVTVLVTTAEGTPCEHANVTLRNPDSGSRIDATGDGAGRYAATALGAGSWRLQVSGPGIAVHEQVLRLTPGERRSVRVVADPAADAVLELQFAPRDDAVEVALCAIEVRPQDGRHAAVRRWIARTYDVPAERLIIEHLGLAPGHYRVEITERALGWHGTADLNIEGETLRTRIFVGPR